MELPRRKLVHQLKTVQASEYENKGADGEATLHFNFDGTGNVEMSIEPIK